MIEVIELKIKELNEKAEEYAAQYNASVAEIDKHNANKVRIKNIMDVMSGGLQAYSEVVSLLKKEAAESNKVDI